MSLISVIRRFTPNWFTVIMGTGITALMLDQLPYGAAAAHPLALGLWWINVALFVLFALIYAAHWLVDHRAAARIFDHATMPLFLGAIPMAMATVINGLLDFQPWAGAVALAHGLWWLDTAMSVACACCVPFMMFTRQDHRFETMTAAWILPIVPCAVAAGSDGLLIHHIADPAYAVNLLYIGYALWAMAIPMALGILVLLFLRLVLHKLPSTDMAMSGWLCLGPLGMGGFGLQSLGQDAEALAGHEPGVAVLGHVALGFGVLGALMLWGYGIWWLGLALLKTARYLRQGTPFNLGWWALTFPLGTYALGTNMLADVTGMMLFRLTAEGLIALLVALWLLVVIRTVIALRRGDLDTAPRRLALDEEPKVAASSANR